MVSPRRARPSVDTLFAKYGRSGARIALILGLLYGALKLDDRVSELEHRERSLQSRANAVAQRETQSDTRERLLRDELSRLEQIRVAADKLPPEPRPLPDTMVSRAGRHSETLPVSGH